MLLVIVLSPVGQNTVNSKRERHCSLNFCTLKKEINKCIHRGDDSERKELPSSLHDTLEYDEH